MNWRPIFILLLCGFLASCGSEPSAPDSSHPPNVGRHGIYILCEGLIGMNNSTLMRYDDASHTMWTDFFHAANPSLRIGDTGSDVIVRGDTTYIVVSHSNTIECIQTSTGTWLGRMLLPGDKAPRALCIVNDTLGFVSNLYGSSVTVINPRTLTVRVENIPVGPAPEGIATNGKYVFVANSGLGKYGDSLPGARTVSVIDAQSMMRITDIPVGPNTVNVLTIPQRNRLYALYLTVPHKTTWPPYDSLGGVIEYDATSFQPLRHWRLQAVTYTMVLSATADTLYTITSEGVRGILLASDTMETPLLVPNSDPQRNQWYSLGVAPDGTFWIGNARDYQVNGEIIVARSGGTVLQTFPAGLNPSTVVFF